ncbi:MULTISPECIES: LacI family DNA-binding transcriptional regulator [Inquilinus]|uniref:DNA-binding LacI/PurR family transcriptional regulator n=1 Tax=Inquilinus ginsengisoli TaxID=363840 RepID=A0ABU1JRX3_9PROT|nr:LacI family DNA-binding transcriptional regulator [Inquilinus ginsengisoli]MDR6291352.1 DNA-binding LacI/PurR family transcriptional regulator [Inquilinus ginsengisoli]
MTGRAGPRPFGGVERATAQQVADAAGVSISAVSRTFTKHASVSPRMRARVLAAAEALGYRPNQLARSLMTGRTELVGLVSTHFANPAFMDVFDLFTRELQRRGLRPLIANLSEDGHAAAALDMMLQYNVDAVLIATSAPPEGFAASCARAGLPVVHVFGRAGTDAPVPVVTVDNVAGGRLAAQAMLARGLRRLAFLGGAPSDASSIDRAAGFAQELAGAGLQPVAVDYAGDYSHEHGRRAMHALLDAHRPDAVFCGDDILALGALDACRERSVRVPEEIGVVGFDDMKLAAWPGYSLTTIRQPMAEMVRHAIGEIAARLADPAHELRSRLFEIALVERGSL